MDANEATRWKQLGEENAKLKRIVADQTLDTTMLKDLVGKMVDPQARRTAVTEMRQAHGASERRACGLLGQARSTQCYRAKLKQDDGLLKRIAALAKGRPRFGYRRLTALLQ